MKNTDFINLSEIKVFGEPVPEGICSIERQVNYPYNDLPGKSRVPVKTENDCAVLCYAEPQCLFWGYDINHNLCWLKDVMNRVTNVPHIVSGQKACGEESLFVTCDNE